MVCVRTEYVLEWCSMFNSPQFDMQHIFYFLTQPQGGRGCVLGHDMRLPGALCLFSITLI